MHSARPQWASWALAEASRPFAGSLEVSHKGLPRPSAAVILRHQRNIQHQNPQTLARARQGLLLLASPASSLATPAPTTPAAAKTKRAKTKYPTQVLPACCSQPGECSYTQPLSHERAPACCFVAAATIITSTSRLATSSLLPLATSLPAVAGATLGIRQTHDEGEVHSVNSRSSHPPCGPSPLLHRPLAVARRKDKPAPTTPAKTKPALKTKY